MGLQHFSHRNGYDDVLYFKPLAFISYSFLQMKRIIGFRWISERVKARLLRLRVLFIVKIELASCSHQKKMYYTFAIDINYYTVKHICYFTRTFLKSSFTLQ